MSVSDRSLRSSNMIDSSRKEALPKKQNLNPFDFEFKNRQNKLSSSQLNHAHQHPLSIQPFFPPKNTCFWKAKTWYYSLLLLVFISQSVSAGHYFFSFQKRQKTYLQPPSPPSKTLVFYSKNKGKEARKKTKQTCFFPFFLLRRSEVEAAADTFNHSHGQKKVPDRSSDKKVTF